VLEKVDGDDVAVGVTMADDFAVNPLPLGDRDDSDVGAFVP